MRLLQVLLRRDDRDRGVPGLLAGSGREAGGGQGRRRRPRLPPHLPSGVRDVGGDRARRSLPAGDELTHRPRPVAVCDF